VTQIFVDTSFIVALINERDQYHERAVELADRYNSQSLIITDVAIAIGNRVSGKINRAKSRTNENELVREAGLDAFSC
jgi:hypothetical protein